MGDVVIIEGSGVAIVQTINEPVYRCKSWQTSTKKPDPKQGLPQGLTKVPKGKPQSVPAEAGVCCGPGGIAKIWLYARPSLKVKGERRGSSVIPNVPPEDNDRIGRAVKNFLSTGGRVRSEFVIFWPNEHSEVWPDKFVFRWEPLPKGGTVSLRLASMDGSKTLWQEKDADGDTGNLTSETARAALRQWHDQDGAGTLLLEMRTGTDSPKSVGFAVISAESEAALEQELAQWDKAPPGVFRHLGRAAALDARQLYAEEAEEFEAALRLEPDSPALRKRTADAHRLYGNHTRADELDAASANRRRAAQAKRRLRAGRSNEQKERRA